MRETRLGRDDEENVFRSDDGSRPDRRRWRNRTSRPAGTGTPSYADTIAWIQQNITGQATQNNGRALWSYDSKQPSQTHISILSLNYETSDRRKHQYS
jgi:hypothetical protein